MELKNIKQKRIVNLYLLNTSPTKEGENKRKRLEFIIFEYLEENTMTYKEFAAIVASEKPELTVSQKSNTERGGVMVTFKPGGKAYIYKGSYQQILGKLGIDKMGKLEKDKALLSLQNLLDYYKRNNGKKGIFTGKTLDYAREIEDTERKIKELETKY